jgi:hypothetical protein
MVILRCGVCRSLLEKRQVRIEDTTAERCFCSQCGVGYRQNEICQVCGLAKPDTTFVVTVYRSAILGIYCISHCSECRPPSKISLEFQQSFSQAFIKYVLVYGGLALCALLLIVAIFAGQSH